MLQIALGDLGILNVSGSIEGGVQHGNFWGAWGSMGINVFIDYSNINDCYRQLSGYGQDWAMYERTRRHCEMKKAKLNQ